MCALHCNVDHVPPEAVIPASRASVFHASRGHSLLQADQRCRGGNSVQAMTGLIIPLIIEIWTQAVHVLQPSEGDKRARKRKITMIQWVWVEWRVWRHRRNHCFATRSQYLECVELALPFFSLMGESRELDASWLPRMVQSSAVRSSLGDCKSVLLYRSKSNV